MKLLFTTIADQNIKDMTEITHPIFKRFAKAWNADFLILDEKYDAIDCPGTGRIYYRMMEIYNLLKIYDRVLLIDSDMLINKSCPNIFEIVPYEKIGVVYEDKGSLAEERYRRILKIQKMFGYIGWKTGYVNSGCLLVSKIHKDIFQKIDGQYYHGRGWNDVLLGYNIHKLGFEVYELPYLFNHQRVFSEKWNGSPSRFDSYIIHYAGEGIREKRDIFGKKIKTRAQQIKSDSIRMYGNKES